MNKITSRSRWFIVLFTFSFVFLAIVTLDDYGFTWDAAEYHIGDKYFYFFKELNPEYLRFGEDNIPVDQWDNHPDFHRYSRLFIKNPYQVWPVGVITSSLCKYLFFTTLGVMDPIDAHHLAVPLLVAILVVALYFFMLNRFGFYAAAISVITLVSYPRFWADLHHNTKDVPGCVFFSLVLIMVVWAWEKMSAAGMLAAAVMWGIALAAKANAVFLPLIIVPYLICEVIYRRDQEKRLPSRAMMMALLISPMIAFLTMLALWPYLVMDFPHHLKLYFAYLKWRGGSGDESWNVLPLLHALATMPLSVMAILIIGIAAMVRQTRHARAMMPLSLLILLWLIVPVLRVSLPRAVDFDGIRHWLEFVPAVAILAGVGGSKVLHRLTRRVRTIWYRLWQSNWRWSRPLTNFALICIYFLPLMLWNYHHHPHQIAYFNRLVGKLPGAQSMNLPEATDYWGSSYRQGMRWINHHAPPGSYLLVGVGEHIVHTTAKIWLRPDIKNVSLTGEPGMPLLEDDDYRAIQSPAANVYLMYITRIDHYTEFVKSLDIRHTPVYQILVDDAPILKILKIK